MDTTWTETAEQRLATLWREGASGGAIATALGREFGLGLSRSAVMGKISRMGLTGQQGSAARAPDPAPAPSVERPPYIFRPPVAPTERPREGFHLFDLAANGCRYPITADHVRADQHRFCGLRCAPGQSYCEGHCLEAFSVRGTGGVSYARAAGAGRGR